jgi:hypothetical protein
MRNVAPAAWLLMLVVGCTGCNKREDPAATGVHADAVAEFKQRIDAYMTIHDEVERGSGAETQTTSAADMDARREHLRDGIRQRRADAKPGDIFSPSVATAFRQLLNPEVRGDNASGTRSSIREGAPKEFSLKPNADYPDDASFATLPPNVLAVLPALPDHLEYRMVDNNLILRDVHANIVVDYMFDVMCAAC